HAALRSFPTRRSSDLLRQRSRINATPATGTVGMIYLPRVHRLQDGRMQDFIFGDLLGGEGLAKPGLALEQPWPAGGSAHRSDGTDRKSTRLNSSHDQI